MADRVQRIAYLARFVNADPATVLLDEIARPGNPIHDHGQTGMQVISKLAGAVADQLQVPVEPTVAAVAGIVERQANIRRLQEPLELPGGDRVKSQDHRAVAGCPDHFL